MRKSGPFARLFKGTELHVAFAFATVAILVVYFLTAYPSVSWWEGTSYPIAATCLGISAPPGSLITALVGFPVTRIVSPEHIAFALNFLAGVVALLAVLVTAIIAFTLIRGDDDPSDSYSGTRAKKFARAAGVAIGAMTFAFGQTLWTYATQYTPYVFTALFTTLILGALVNWWIHAEDRLGLRWLFIVALLFGLDFSVHRTNALLIPGVLFWVLLRKPGLLKIPKFWGVGFGGLLLGLAFHLLLIPLARREPFLNMSDPGTLSGLWDYVALKQAGGGFLVDLFPRNGPFFSSQVMDYLRGFSVNFFNLNGPWGIIGILPTLCGFIGLAAMWRRYRRLTYGFIILFLFTSLGAIVYFNVPENYFRNMFRHYLPSFVIFSIWMAYGISFLLMALVKTVRKLQWIPVVAMICLLALLPVRQVVSNFSAMDHTGNYFARDYGANLLASLPEDAILITFGDNDTFTAWYMQEVERYRTDAAVLNLWLLSTDWFVRQVRSREPGMLPDTPDDEIAAHGAKPWTDSTVYLPVVGDNASLGLAGDAIIPDSIPLHIVPSMADRYLMPYEWRLFEMIRNNQWRRPLYFSTAGGGAMPAWLRDYLRIEGIVYRFVPEKNPAPDLDILKENLYKTYSYRGFADPAVRIDIDTRSMARNYLSPCLQLAAMTAAEGDTKGLATQLHLIDRLLAPDRLKPLPEQMEEMLTRLQNQVSSGNNTETADDEPTGSD